MLFWKVVLSVLASSWMMAQAFTVGTINLWHYTTDHSNRSAALKREFSEYGLPEILSSQEAARWNGQPALYDEMMALTGYKGFYQNTNEFGLMNEGLALDGGFPGRNFESLELPGTNAFSRQYMVAGIFETEIGPVGVISTHFSPMGNNSNQHLQAQFIMKYIKTKLSHVPVIVLGDLNQYPSSRTLQVFKDEGFTDSLDWKEKTYVPKENPYNDSKYGAERLDYVLYRPSQLKLVSSSLMFNKNIISDHYGIKAEFTALD